MTKKVSWGMQLAKIHIVCVYNTRFRGKIVCYLLKM